MGGRRFFAVDLGEGTTVVYAWAPSAADQEAFATADQYTPRVGGRGADTAGPEFWEPLWASQISDKPGTRTSGMSSSYLLAEADVVIVAPQGCGEKRELVLGELKPIVKLFKSKMKTAAKLMLRGVMFWDTANVEAQCTPCGADPNLHEHNVVCMHKEVVAENDAAVGGMLAVASGLDGEIKGEASAAGLHFLDVFELTKPKAAAPDKRLPAYRTDDKGCHFTGQDSVPLWQAIVGQIRAGLS